MTVNFQQLRCFHAVATHGSFTAASHSLFVGQPSITTHVKSLEKRFGVELFYRHGHIVRLTHTGERLFGFTQKIFSLEKELEETLKSAGGLLEGKIRLSAFDPVQVTGLASRFHAKYPHIGINISFGNAEILIDSLLSLKADVSILPRLDDKRLYTIHYQTVNVILLVASNHPLARADSIAISQLAGEEMISRERGSMQQRVVNDLLNSHDIEVRYVLEIDSQDAMREAIASGMGVGIALDSVDHVDPRLQKVNILDSQDMALTLDLEIACLHDRRKSPVIKAFFDLYKY